MKSKKEIKTSIFMYANKMIKTAGIDTHLQWETVFN